MKQAGRGNFTRDPQTSSSHLKMDGWNTLVSFWDGLFSRAMIVSGSVVDENFKSLAQATSLECRHVQVADACKGPAVAEMPCCFFGEVFRKLWENEKSC